MPPPSSAYLPPRRCRGIVSTARRRIKRKNGRSGGGRFGCDQYLLGGGGGDQASIMIGHGAVAADCGRMACAAHRALLGLKARAVIIEIGLVHRRSPH